MGICRSKSAASKLLILLLIKNNFFQYLHSAVLPTLLPPIRFLEFSALKGYGEFPRLSASVSNFSTIELSSVPVENSLIVFVSHCWLRGWSGAVGWDGRPHPDDVSNGKYKLCVEGIEMLLRLAPGVSNCYVWLDFACINQDGNPAGELKQLDKIIESCDCIFTPIVDHDKWDFPTSGISNLFSDYKAKAWNDGPQAYLNRGWCRVEMFYAANIPLLPSHNTKQEKVLAGLKSSILSGRRPHILYGSKESRELRPPRFLPPLQNSYFEQFNPCLGTVSVPSDMEKINELVEVLKPYMKKTVVGYTGERKGNLMHGYGKMVYENGSVYEGRWAYDKANGRGTITYASGAMYTGGWKDGVMHGQGVYTYASGAVYTGGWENDKKNGKGVYSYPSGNVYDGMWKDNKKEGIGVYTYTSGDVYEGRWANDMKNGRGVYKFANGNIYDGNWKDDKMNGDGCYKYANGTSYTGTWKDGVILKS